MSNTPSLETAIAVVGMAGRFPGASDVHQFWRNIHDGIASITLFSDADVVEAGADPAVLKDPNLVKAGAILDDVERFDAAFFGLTPREAEILDPQQRMFLEESWNALEDAGYDPARYPGKIAMVAGVGLSTYLLNNLHQNRALREAVGELQLILGNDKDSLTTRAAYLFGLTGPCYTVQTYCSTSLVAVANACENLIGGVCDMALAGGSHIAIPQRAGYFYQEGGIASPDALCRAFDAKANGSPLGNGVAVVLLKRLSDAIAERDNIHAVIRGWAVNNDGGLRAGYTAPSTRGQTEVILQALANAGVHSETIGYFEAHGTGTALGDAVEFSAMVKAFRQQTMKRNFCAVGSVKTNIGHLDRAAGVAGLIKTVMAMKHRHIPASLNYERPHPDIDFSDTPFFVNTTLRPWARYGDHPRRAGVSSFGIGGTNAHVILEEAPPPSHSPCARLHHLIPLSARTPSALRSAGNNLRAALEAAPDLEISDVAYTLQVGRKACEHRAILVCGSRAEAIETLRRDLSRTSWGVEVTQERPVTFMFGSTSDCRAQLDGDLYRTERVFRKTIDECREIVRGLVDVGVCDLLDPAPISSFVVEYALAQLLQSWGVIPESLIARGPGEYVAACVAGVLSVEETLRLVARRIQLTQALPQHMMVAVALPEAELQAFLVPGLYVVAVDGPMSCVAAGPPEAMASLTGRMITASIGFLQVETAQVCQNQLSAAIIADLGALLRNLRFRPPRIPYVSTITGNWIADGEATNPAYWLRHLPLSTRFGQGLETLFARPDRLLLEIGPGNALSNIAKQHPACAPDQRPWIISALPGANDSRSDASSLLEGLGRIWTAGCLVDWDSFWGEDRPMRVALPTYPFERQRFWIDPPSRGRTEQRAVTVNISKTACSSDWFYAECWRPSPLRREPQGQGGAYLLFEDSLGLGTTIAQCLGNSGASVTRVRIGNSFERLAPDLFAIRPDVAGDYTELFSNLKQSGRWPDKVVHLWTLDRSEETDTKIADFRPALRVGFYSVLFCAQALARQVLAPVTVNVITYRVLPPGGIPLRPEKATVVGLCRVVSQEFPNIRCRVVDVDLPSDIQEGARLGEHLSAELLEKPQDVAVAYRAGIRYAHFFEPRKLTAQPTAGQLRSGGVYLICGGLGQIGLCLAEYLVREFCARVVLTSRSGLPRREDWDHWLASHPESDTSSQRIRRVRSLEALGSEVLVLAADVTDETAMHAAVNETVARFGGLSGVIHAAAQPAADIYMYLHDATMESCEAQFAAKVSGVYVLERVLQGRDVDFCVVFSSLSAVLGGLGLGTYAAANAFMDAFAEAHSGSGGPRWMSVNWDSWFAPARTYQASVDEFAMTAEEGIASFALAIASGQPRLIHSTGDLASRFRQWVMLDTVDPQTTGMGAHHARPVLATPYVPVGNEYESRILAIWQELLGVDGIGVDDNFFDLGGNSLIGLQLASRLQKAFDHPVPATALFLAPTISKLAAFLRSGLQSPPGETAAPDIHGERRRKARRRPDNSGVAIIGMSGRFPKAATVEQFWDNLCGGVEAISFLSEEELTAAGVSRQTMGRPDYVRARPVLDHIDQFDASFFGYSPRDAELLDPQHRVFLECTWEALELAGYDSDRYEGRIGVYAGSNIGLYALPYINEVANEPEAAEKFLQGVLSNDKDALTTTVSYKLNLRGPSVAVQTYCSTSLVAVHMACQSVLNGECDLALAGGASILFLSKRGYIYQEGGQDSPDGHCRAFDAEARGAVFGDGVAVVVLKRLEDALEDGDTIHAVIKGSAVNNDGSLKVGYTAPSVAGQAEAIVTALDNSNVHAESIGYVEAHGTATPLGDPIEVLALTQAFRKYSDRKCFCPIGSVKTNVGHLNQSAGVTGLIKAALVVKTGFIPASLHYKRPNPEIDFANSPFYVNAVGSEWSADKGRPRRACVNALGVGGTNAFAVIEEPPEPKRSQPVRKWQLLTISARSAPALDQATLNLAEFLRRTSEPDLADIAYTLQVGRRAFAHRRIAVCENTKQALSDVEAQDAQRLISGQQSTLAPPVSFLLAGVGDHYEQMGRGLYEGEPVFRDIVDQCSNILLPALGARLSDLLYPANGDAPARESGAHDAFDVNGERVFGNSKLEETRVAQPAVFVVEYALARLLMSWGVQPQALLGYSLGEYVAACLAGVMSMGDALKLVFERARMINALPEGRMLAVALPADDMRSMLPERVWLAIRSGPRSCVVAGDPDAIARLRSQLVQQDIACRGLGASHAFHTPLLHPAKDELSRLAATIELKPPRIPFISNLTGEWITPAQATDPRYWAEQMCRQVLFDEGLDVLLQNQEQVLLEIGPGQALGSFAKLHPQCTRPQASRIWPTLRAFHERHSDVPYILTTLGKLWLQGIEVDWDGFHAGERLRRIPLPTYPFERQRFWLDPPREAEKKDKSDGLTKELALEEAMRSLTRQDLTDWFRFPAWKQVAPVVPLFAGATKGSALLLFADTAGVSEQVRSRIGEAFDATIVVKRGASYVRLSESHYQIRPDQRGDYELLLKDLKQRDVVSVSAVHCWNVDQEQTSDWDDEMLNKVLAKGLFSIMCLVQAVKETQVSTCNISVVCTGALAVNGSEKIVPEKATILGPCRVIPLEYTNVDCRTIDIVLPDAGDWRSDALFAHLCGELTSPVGERVVALRGQQRFVQTFEPIPLPAIIPARGDPLRQGGVYLITGGLGGIGLAIGEYLARTVAAKLVLLARSGLPPRDEWARIASEQGTATALRHKINSMRRLEELGAEVLTVRAEVTDAAQVRSAIQQARSRFGNIHGVIHAAGVPGAGLIQLKTAASAAAVLAPKLKGTLVLERALHGSELDFFVLCSSITTATGALGQVDYVAANSFLDAYAVSRLGGKRLTTSIAWNEWQWNAWEAGLNGFPSGVQQFLRENRKQFGITFDEGADAFHRILARRLPQVVVSPQDLGSFIEVSRRFTVEAAVNWGHPAQREQGKRYPRPGVGTSYVAPSSEIEEKIAAIWRDILGLQDVGVHDNFFDLGGNSLVGLDMVARLRRTLDTPSIPIHVLYEAPTVKTLAKFAQHDRGSEVSLLKEHFARGQQRRRQLLKTRTDDLAQ